MHRDTVLAVLAERSFLKKLGGGCFAPVAVCASMKQNILSLRGQVFSVDGSKLIDKKLDCVFDEENVIVDGNGHSYDESGEPAR